MFNKLKFKEALPKIILGLGIVLGGSSLVLVSSKSEEAAEVFKDVRTRKSLIEGYAKKAKRKELRKIYLSAAGKLAKIYWAAEVMALGSAASVCTSYGILDRRVSGLVTLVAALEASYRSALASQGLKGPQSQVVTVNHDTGEVQPLKDSTPWSAYARVFGPDYSLLAKGKSPESIWIDLLNVERSANNRLQMKGYLTLNEVYEMLGLEPSVAGQFVGWLRTKDPDFKYDGDDYVSLGLTDDLKSQIFDKGEDTVILDFNAALIFELGKALPKDIHIEEF